MLYTVPEVELQEGLCQTPSQYKDVQPEMKRTLANSAEVVTSSKPHIHVCMQVVTCVQCIFMNI